MPYVWHVAIRPPAKPGIAFVGDAALATDPLMGVGIAFALRSAEWLADEVSAALRGEEDVDSALRRYRRRFLATLGPHHLQIADFATGRRMRLSERRAFRAAAGDQTVARALGEVLMRERSPARLLDPRIAARVWMRRQRPLARATRPTAPSAQRSWATTRPASRWRCGGPRSFDHGRRRGSSRSDVRG